MRVAIIGLGLRISGLLEQLQLVNPEARLVAVADPDQAHVREKLKTLKANAESVRLYASADQLLQDSGEFDAIMIGTRCHLHTPLAIQAAAVNLPIFLEKPVAISYRQLTDLARAFRGHEDRVVVSFPLRVTPLFLKAIELVRSGRIGTVNQIQAINNVPYGGVYFGTWYRNYEQDGGLWLQKATHDFDYLTLLANSRPTQISAMITQKIYGGDKPHNLKCSQCDITETCMESPQNLKKRGDDGGMGYDDHWCAFSRDIRNEDAGSAIVRYENDLHISYTQNFISRRSAGRRGAIITGYAGSVDFDWYTFKVRLIEHFTDKVEEFEINAVEGHGGGDKALMKNFVEVTRGAAPAYPNLTDGLRSVALCLAARESSHKRTFQTIPPTEQIADYFDGRPEVSALTVK
ncbi:MAG: Gfo/Idh/MocA family oxidoreductase [Phycisphaerales bacterium]|jgi:predicted dehydrogenase|nr:Gfo/Idh/MocA family oxidoreductase [Phycisphaerales bacterium]